MKYITGIILVGLLVFGCESSKSTISNTSETSVANDTVRIANDSLEYEIIIIEPGFNGFLIGQPPRGYYTQSFLENRNRIFVTQYNQRAMGNGFDISLYPQPINYSIGTDYGYEVNYMLYNYFLFFSDRYNQKFQGARN